MGRKGASRIHQGQGIHPAILRHPLDQAQVPVYVRAGGIDGEEHDVQALLVSVACGGNRHFDRPLQRPAVGILEHVLTARNLDDGTIGPAVHHTLNILHHAACQGKDLGTELAAGNRPHSFLVVPGDGRRARLDAVYTQLRQCLGDAHFIVFGEQDAHLLLPVPQRQVVDLDPIGKRERPGDFGQIVPGTDKPFFVVPGR